MTAGAVSVPMVLRTRVGDGPYRGHPQSFESWFPHVPGIKVVLPALARDAGQLMRAAIRDPNPVIYFENMRCYHAIREDVPDDDDPLPLGVARVVREGASVTVVATGWLVHQALAVAERLAPEGISIEVIDLRCLAPLDLETIVQSVRKTSRLVVAHESWKFGGFGAEVSAEIAESAFDLLDAPISRVGAPRSPVPSSKSLRDLFLPGEPDLTDAIRRTVAY
jgi:pyruvate dehydrogenase E1 component beta subunit